MAMFYGGNKWKTIKSFRSIGAIRIFLFEC